MTTADKLQGTCSVCLRLMQLRGDRPIRHGFSAIGVQHGQHSGYHTGPCQGTGFPHLGISTEGTQWALGHARERLSSVEEELRKLSGNPDLIWHPTDRRGLPDYTRSVTLRPGEDVQYAGDGRPTYAGELKRRIAKQEALKGELERAITEYRKHALRPWTPEDFHLDMRVEHSENRPQKDAFDARSAAMRGPGSRAWCTTVSPRYRSLSPRRKLRRSSS